MSDLPEKTFKSFTPLGMHGDVSANILERVIGGGKVRYFRDERKSVERIQIDAPQGTLQIYKSYESGHGFWRYKKIDILSLDEEPLGTIDVFTDSTLVMNPSHKFSYLNSLLGGGKGDIEVYIAQKLLGYEVDPRMAAEATVDPDVMDVITKLLTKKTI